MARVDFERINSAALADLPRVLRRWLPDARVAGDDRRLGSFKINIRTGMWADFATGDRGGDPVSLVAYIANSGQIEAARRLADALGIPAEG